ncbi:MAG: hypothetical protein M1828_001853 [Chrysothrix sp. TS-e1954]|nr:MAG: hypothetical protein M1828_001853 [Chrysothrix sp. TS-e1954]
MSPMIIEEDVPRHTKRQKIGADVARGTRATNSRIFAPYRTIGLVSPTSVPFTAAPLGKTTFQITTSVGRCLQTYDLKKGLHLVFLTQPQTPGPITASTTWRDQTLAAWSSGQSSSSRGIWVYRRGKRVDELELPSYLDDDIVDIQVFGSWIIGCCATRIEIWNSSDLEHYSTLSPPFKAADGQTFLTGGVCTVPTFTNKLLAGREDGSVEIWNVKTGKLLYRILPSSSDSGPVTTIQPTPALSLVAIAYLNGRVVIHDIEADKEVIRLNAGHGDHAPITSISFRTDGLGAGSDGRKAGVMATASFKDGDVTFWDLNGGGRRMGTLRGAHRPPSSVKDTLNGGITKVEFLQGQSIMVTSGADNALRTWIFDETPFSPLPRALHSRTGHAAPVTTLNFLPSDADGAEAGGKWLLSTSQDKSFWGWSLRKDSQSTELSQGQVQKKAKKLGTLGSVSTNHENGADALKAPAVTCIACSLNRDGGMGAMPGNRMLWASAKQLKGKSTATEQHITGWESVVTGHKGDRFARTWFWGRKRAGRWIFETEDGGDVTSVTVSPCGTFAVVGSGNGGISMHNLQSGLHRQRYPARLTPAQARRLELEKARNSNTDHSTSGQGGRSTGRGKHASAIKGLHVDNLNRTLISCSVDGIIKVCKTVSFQAEIIFADDALQFWDFLGGTLHHQIDWSTYTNIDSMLCHRSSDLLAVACGDHAIRVIDAETRKLVRELEGCQGKINDICFSNDGRWIVAASSDAVIRIWDLPSGHLIDAMRLRSSCTALAFSNTGEFLVTAQEDAVGVSLWTNRTLFTRVPTRNISAKEITAIAEPTASGEGGQSVIAPALTEPSDASEDESTDGPLPSLDQLSEHVETLSLVPKSRWQTLLHLDLIRARNKPTEKPKAPEKAPFFLPSLHGSKIEANPSTVPEPDESDVGQDIERSRIMKMQQNGYDSKFVSLLRSEGETSKHDQSIEHLKTLNPAAADIEIRSLSDAAPYSDLKRFIGALTTRLRAKRDYELVQTWMAVFLKCHGETLIEDPDMINMLQTWRNEQKQEADRLNRLVGYCSGVARTTDMGPPFSRFPPISDLPLETANLINGGNWCLLGQITRIDDIEAGIVTITGKESTRTKDVRTIQIHITIPSFDPEDFQLGNTLIMPGARKTMPEEDSGIVDPYVVIRYRAQYAVLPAPPKTATLLAQIRLPPTVQHDLPTPTTAPKKSRARPALPPSPDSTPEPPTPRAPKNKRRQRDSQLEPLAIPQKPLGEQNASQDPRNIVDLDTSDPQLSETARIRRENIVKREKAKKEEEKRKERAKRNKEAGKRTRGNGNQSESESQVEDQGWRPGKREGLKCLKDTRK